MNWNFQLESNFWKFASHATFVGPQAKGKLVLIGNKNGWNLFQGLYMSTVFYTEVAVNKDNIIFFCWLAT